MSHPRPQPRALTPRGGFTLVELLMVILIIGMLMALLLPAVMAARRDARNTQIKLDIENQLVNALTDFKAKYGAFPPDRSWTDQEITTFIRRAFPRINQTNLNEGLVTVQNMTHAQALVFWLGGYWDGNKMIGFSLDPQFPFQVPNGAVNHPSRQRIKMAELPETRLYEGSNNRLLARGANARIAFPEFYPPGFDPAETSPYVYFGARPNSSYFNANGNMSEYAHPPQSPNVRFGVATPYHQNRVGTPVNPSFVNEESFQIVCGGIDEDYGQTQTPERFQKVFPLGTNYGPGDEDNLVSFSGKTLGDARP